MTDEAELLKRLRNREKNSIDEANDYEIKKENITFVDSCNTYNWSYCCGSNRKDFNVDKFISITY